LPYYYYYYYYYYLLPTSIGKKAKAERSPFGCEMVEFLKNKPLL